MQSRDEQEERQRNNRIRLNAKSGPLQVLSGYANETDKYLIKAGHGRFYGGYPVQAACQYAMIKALLYHCPQGRYGGMGNPNQHAFIAQSVLHVDNFCESFTVNSMDFCLSNLHWWYVAFFEKGDSQKAEEYKRGFFDYLAKLEKYVAAGAGEMGKYMKSAPSYLTKIESAASGLFRLFSQTCHWRYCTNFQTYEFNMTQERYVASIGEVNQSVVDTCNKHFKDAFSRNWLAGASNN